MSRDIVMLFFMFSFTGWLIEFVFRSIYERRLVNPGFHKGPWLPVYGLTGLAIILVSGELGRQSIVIRMIFYFVLSSGIELFAGLFLEKAFSRRYWDYSENRFNIKGFICPLYSCGWVLICLVVEYFILGRMISLISIIPSRLLLQADALLLTVFSLDFISSSGIGRGRIRLFIKKVIIIISKKWKHV